MTESVSSFAGGAPSLSIADTVSASHELQEEYGLSEEELKQFIQTQKRTPQSALRQAQHAIGTSVSDALNRAAVIRPEVVIDVALDGDAMRRMRDDYPDFNIRFTPLQRRDHATAHGRRKLDRQLLRKRVPMGEKYVDVGGDYEYNLVTNETAVHACCPVVDKKDEVRAHNRDLRVRARVTDRGTPIAVRARLARFLSDSAPWKCEKRAEECTVAADYLVVCHVYDMTHAQIARALESHSAQVAVGCILAVPQMRDSSDGRLTSVGGWFETVGTRVRYGFDMSSSWSYEHDKANVLSFLTDRVFSDNGRRYVYCVDEVRGDCVFYSIRRMSSGAEYFDFAREAYMDQEGPWAVVNGYKLASMHQGTAGRGLVPQQYIYPWATWSKVLEYAVRQRSAGKFNLEDLARQYRAYSKVVTFNSTRVGGVDGVNSDDLAGFLANVAIAACLITSTAQEEAHALSYAALQERALAAEGTVERLVAAIKTVWDNPFPQSEGLVTLWSRLWSALSVRGLAFLRTLTWFKDEGYRVHQVARGCDATHDFDQADLMRREDPDHVTAYIVAAAMKDPNGFGQIVGPMLDESTQVALLELQAKQVETDAHARAQRVQALREANDNPDLEGPAHDVASGSGPWESGSSELRPVGRDALVWAAERGITLQDTDDVVVNGVDTAKRWDTAIRAMREYLEYLRYQDEVIESQCRNGWRVMTRSGVPEATAVRHWARDQFEADFWFFEKGKLAESSNSFRGRPSVLFEHSAVYVPHPGGRDGMVLVSRDRVKDQLDNYKVRLRDASDYTGWVLVSTESLIYNGPDIAHSVTRALAAVDVRRELVLVMHDGVFGFGKTYYVYTTAAPDSMILASGRDNTDETRRLRVEFDRVRQLEHPEHVPFQRPSLYVRTIDSFLVRPSKTRPVERLAIDECFMEHPGKIWACIVLTGATHVELHGDTRQVPFVNRSDRTVRYTRIEDVDCVVTHHITRRCPADVCVALGSQYDYKIRTRSTILSSLKFTPDVTFDSLRYDPNVQYLTMYQEDKATLFKNGFRNVRTVAEAEGRTYEHVVLVRIQMRKQQLFDSAAYVVVAMSRHKVSFNYVCPAAASDLVQSAIERAGSDFTLVQRATDIATAGKSLLVS